MSNDFLLWVRIHLGTAQLIGIVNVKLLTQKQFYYVVLLIVI